MQPLQIRVMRFEKFRRWAKPVARMCAASLLASPAHAAQVPPPAPSVEIQRLPVQVLESFGDDRQGSVELVVRQATLDEQGLIRRHLDESRGGALLGLGVAGLSAAGAASAAATGMYMYSGAMAAGAILILPLSLMVYALGEREAAHLRKGLDLERFLNELRGSLPPASGPAVDPGYEVEVLLVEYGLVDRRLSERDAAICLIADVQVSVKHVHATIYQETLFLEPFLRSADAPPPPCRQIDDWVEQEGARLAAARRTLAQAIARMIRARLEVLPWHAQSTSTP